MILSVSRRKAVSTIYWLWNVIGSLYHDHVHEIMAPCQEYITQIWKLF
jgi:hypothetical protein